MGLFSLTLRKKRYSFIGLALLLPLMLAVTRFRIAATDAQIKDMLSILEVFYPFFASLFVCCIIPRMTEAELIVLSGGSLTVSALYEFAALFAISLASGEIAGLLLLPAWERAQFALSFPVTLLFIFALELAIRFAVNSIYANIGVQTALFLLLFLGSGMAPESVVSHALTKRDLFVDGYAHTIFTGSSGNRYLRFGDVMENRLVFLLASAALLTAALILSKQARLYNIKR